MGIEPEFKERFARFIRNPSIFFNLRSNVLFQASIPLELDGRSARFGKLKIKITQKMNETDLMKRVGERFSDRL